jgi:cysteinyl-tRNA synthetase
MTDVLGLDPLSEQWCGAAGAGDDGAKRALSSLVDELIAERAQARARRDFAAADAVRARLLTAGVLVEDTRDGATWTLKDGCN